jgi:hypothetical protein
MENRILILFVVIIAAEIFWLIQLLDLMKRSDRTFPGRYDKPIWAVFLLICNLIGAIAYWMAKNLRDMPELLEVNKPEKEYPEPCIKCGKIIPPNTTKCPSCGWTYEDQGKEIK